MSRPKKYDREVAVEKACRAFWKYGYSAIGVRGLEELTGLNRFAIQTEFKGKEGLFLEALGLYTKKTQLHFLGPLNEGGLNEIETLFKGLMTSSSESYQVFGCLMVNTIIENAILKRVEIQNKTDNHFKQFEKAFRNALTSSKTKNELIQNFELEDAVTFLVGSTMGIQVMIRKEGAIKSVEGYSKMILSMLESWRKKPIRN